MKQLNEIFWHQIAPTSISQFLSNIGIHFALGQVISCKVERLYDGDLHAVGRGFTSISDPTATTR